MMYFNGGKMENSHFGTNSKLQCPILFMKSMYAIYPMNCVSEAFPVKSVDSIGIENSIK